MADLQTKRRSPRRVMWDCGVPAEHCTGGTRAVNINNMNNPNRYKVHGDYGSARKCNQQYCKMRSAEGGGILIPSKPQQVKCSKGQVLLHPKVRG